MNSLIKFVLAIITSFLMLGIFSPGKAQQAPPQQQPPQQQQPQQVPQQQPQQAIEISEEDFEKFIEVVKAAEEVEMEIDQKRNAILESEGLDQQDLNRMIMAQQNPEAADDVSEEEMEKFDAVAEELTKLGMEQQQAMQELIADKGMSIQEFQQVHQGIQQNPEMMQRLQEELGM